MAEKNINNRQNNIISIMKLILSKAATHSDITNEARKINDCAEGKKFTLQEIELLLITAAQDSFQQKTSLEKNSVNAKNYFINYLRKRIRNYLVPFATKGLRFFNAPYGVNFLKIGSCEFCFTHSRIEEIFSKINVPVRKRFQAVHVFERQGVLIVPPHETIAVISVDTSSFYARIEAQAYLEEAYGFFALYYDAISCRDAPHGPKTRMPLISWQSMRSMAPICYVSTDNIDRPAWMKFGLGSIQLWDRGYSVNLSTELPKLN